jgi:ATP-dependent RNA helicase DDX24/MAK5
VPVTLSGCDSESTNTNGKNHSMLKVDVEDLTSNHYDDPILSKQAEKDLPMNPGNDCGIFFGLEVLDPSQYQVVRTGNSRHLMLCESFEDVVVQNTQNQIGQENNELEKEEPAIESRKKRKKETIKSSNIHSAVMDHPKHVGATASGENNIRHEPELGGRTVKKRKTKSTEKSKVKDEKETSDDTTEQIPISPDELAHIQASWSEASGGAHIHSRLLESLHRLGFAKPTPIQEATLSASIMGRRNLVGAAPTGSGKTLAFLIPILNHILEQNDNERKDKRNGLDEVVNKGHCSTALQALIITPTRELASQIHAECDKLFPSQCVTLVGGIALVKQKRLLDTMKPSIVIATPGRLWAMVS